MKYYFYFYLLTTMYTHASQISLADLHDQERFLELNQKIDQLTNQVTAIQIKFSNFKNKQEQEIIHQKRLIKALASSTILLTSAAMVYLFYYREKF